MSKLFLRSLSFFVVGVALCGSSSAQIIILPDGTVHHADDAIVPVRIINLRALTDSIGYDSTTANCQADWDDYGCRRMVQIASAPKGYYFCTANYRVTEIIGGDVIGAYSYIDHFMVDLHCKGSDNFLDRWGCSITVESDRANTTLIPEDFDKGERIANGCTIPCPNCNEHPGPPIIR
jgi:hypothetical protein